MPLHVTGDFVLREENSIKIQLQRKRARFLLLSRLLSEGSKSPPSLHAHPELLLDFASWYPPKGGVILVWLGDGRSRLNDPSLGIPVASPANALPASVALA